MERYLRDKTTSPHALWRFNNKVRKMQAGKTLRVGTLAAATVNWAATDGRPRMTRARVTPALASHVADLSTQALKAGATVTFTFHWTDANRWERHDFSVAVD